MSVIDYIAQTIVRVINFVFFVFFYFDANGAPASRHYTPMTLTLLDFSN